MQDGVLGGDNEETMKIHSKELQVARIGNTLLISEFRGVSKSASVCFNFVAPSKWPAQADWSSGCWMPREN